MNTIRMSVLPILALAGLALVACGDKEPVDFGDALPDGAIQVDEKANSFDPSDLTISVLDTVYFTNGSTALHNVIIEGDNVSGDMERGDVFSFTFPEEGEFEILCGYHPQMTATITVE